MLLRYPSKKEAPPIWSGLDQWSTEMVRRKALDTERIRKWPKPILVQGNGRQQNRPTNRRGAHGDQYYSIL